MKPPAAVDLLRAVPALIDLFPEEDYRFALTLRRGEAGEFFRPWDPTGSVLAERRAWVAQEPARYTASAPEAGPLLAELQDCAAEWGLPPFAGVAELAGGCEADVLLLSREPGDRFRLRGGALVFPSGWDLRDKLGRSVASIHGVVPGLNDALEAAIDRALAGIKPGAAHFRTNWGLSACAEYNAHPSRGLPSPAPPAALDRLWLRVEHQALVALPRTRGLVFAIRIALHRFDAAVREPGVAAGLERALRTMPPALARYKRIDAISDELQALLRPLFGPAGASDAAGGFAGNGRH